MKFLNGFKTVLGLVGSVAVVVFNKVDPGIISAAGDHVYGIVQGAFGLLTILGVIHKAEKAGIVAGK